SVDVDIKEVTNMTFKEMENYAWEKIKKIKEDKNKKLELLFDDLNNLMNDFSSIRLEYESNIEYGETGKEEKQMDHLSQLIEIEQKLRNIERNLYFDTYESRFLNE